MGHIQLKVDALDRAPSGDGFMDYDSQRSQRGQIPLEAWGAMLLWAFYVVVAAAVACAIYVVFFV